MDAPVPCCSDVMLPLFASLRFSLLVCAQLYEDWPKLTALANMLSTSPMTLTFLELSRPRSCVTASLNFMIPGISS